MGRKIEKIKRWSQSRGVRSVVANIAIVIAVFVVVSLWQGRHLLSSGERAPNIALRALDGTMMDLNDQVGRRVLLYFFAPWCKVCDTSVSNLTTLRAWRPESDLAIYLVALDYETVDAVREFVARNNLNLPVLMGDVATQAAYRVNVYPTYYVIDTDGNVRGKSTGYSTFLGMFARTFTR